MDKLAKITAAACGAILSFITGLPPLMWVLLGVMCLDYATGLMCGLVGVSPKTEGGGLSSREAFSGLMRKMMILAVVLLAVLLDFAVAHGAAFSLTLSLGRCACGSLPARV